MRRFSRISTCRWIALVISRWVKPLFKHAEEQRDLELIGACLVAFDTLVRRVRTKHWQWDCELRQSYETERLATPRT